MQARGGVGFIPRKGKKVTLFDLNAPSDGSRDGRRHLARHHVNPIFLVASHFTHDADNAQQQAVTAAVAENVKVKDGRFLLPAA